MDMTNLLQYHNTCSKILPSTSTHFCNSFPNIAGCSAELIFTFLYGAAASKMQAIHLMCPQTLFFIQSHKQKSKELRMGIQTTLPQ